jgi:hypothetical protein
MTTLDDLVREYQHINERLRSLEQGQTQQAILARQILEAALRLETKLKSNRWSEA